VPARMPCASSWSACWTFRRARSRTTRRTPSRSPCATSRPCRCAMRWRRRRAASRRRAARARRGRGVGDRVQGGAPDRAALGTLDVARTVTPEEERLLIGRLTGRIARRLPQEVLLDVGGVGYRVSIPLSTFCSLPGDEEPTSLEIYTLVRDDAILLYGFGSLAEKDVFEA